MSLEIDFETRSSVDLKVHGAYRYFASPDADVLMASFSFDGQPVRRWRRGDHCSGDVYDWICDGGHIMAHNAQFERLAFQFVMGPKYGWPMPRIDQFRCTAAMAAAMSLPRHLDGLGEALNLRQQKDKGGFGLIRKFSIPKKATGLFTEPEDDPEAFERFHAYCDRDVEAEAEAARRMVPLSDYEQAVWELDQRINDRGIRVDVKSLLAAVQLAERAKTALDHEMKLVTGGYVTACTEVGNLVEWVQRQGVEMDNATKQEVEDVLSWTDIPDNVRRAVELRQEAAKASVAKLSAMLDRVSADGRVRGSFLYHAAGTGRWSSTGAQLHNMPRGRKEFGDAHLDKRTLFQAIRAGDPAFLQFLYGDRLGRPLHLLSDAVRGFIWAAPGHDLVVADYSSIEGRVNAWLADEEWKLEAFRLNDQKLGPGLYELAAAGIYGCPVEAVTKDQRQVGKVAELALGYQGGVAAFWTMAKGYGVKMDAAFPGLWETADGETRQKASDRYEECLERKDTATDVLTREGWLASELTKVGWRKKHPAISASWKALEEGARQAVLEPGAIVEVLKVAFIVAHGFLWMRLPSGRCLTYGKPRISQVEVPWADKTQPPEKRETRAAVTALGVNSVTKKWERFALYGGLICENAVQAIARDILASGMLKAEAAGYPIIGHVHDEAIAEMPKGKGSVEEFERILCDLPDWAAGLPLVAAGWRGKRYRKD